MAAEGSTSSGNDATNGDGIRAKGDGTLQVRQLGSGEYGVSPNGVSEPAPRAPEHKYANPAPLGLCGFAMTTFLLGLINMGTRGITEPSMVIGPAFGYGGLVQLLAGMWEMARGNTFVATALSSYGGFWISLAIILTPGGFNIESSIVAADNGDPTNFLNSLGLFLFGWFIFTFIMFMLSLRLNAALVFLFFVLDMAYLLLSISYLVLDDGGPNFKIMKAGGLFALLSAFAAWYVAWSLIAEEGFGTFPLPVYDLPWSDKVRQERKKLAREQV